MHLARRTKLTLAVALALVVGGTGTAAVAASSGADLGAKPVFLVRSDNTVDASVAGAAAARAGAPLLYSSPETLDGATRDYLVRYQPTTVVLVGGTKALSQTVEASVKTLGYAPLRVTGADRAETAVKLGDLVSSLPAAKGQKGDPGATGAAGATGATGPAGFGAVRVRDANGVNLGVLTDALHSNGYIAFLTSTGYNVAAAPDGGPDLGRWIFFASNDCTGAPLMSVSSTGIYQKTAWWLDRYNGYYTNAGQSLQTLTTQSRWSGGACVVVTTAGNSVYPVVAVTTSTLGVPSSIIGPLQLTS